MENNNFYEDKLPMQKKYYYRFSIFCDHLLRIIESESRDELKQMLKKDYLVFKYIYICIYILLLFLDIIYIYLYFIYL